MKLLENLGATRGERERERERERASELSTMGTGKAGTRARCVTVKKSSNGHPFSGRM